jgi:Ras-related protein Rab-24
MSRMYYRSAKAAVVCYDVTDARTWEKVKFWVEELKKHESECRIYIVGTKLDLLARNFLLISCFLKVLELPNRKYCGR